LSQTPWDDWSREDLVIEVRRMYAALRDAAGVLAACDRQSGAPGQGFWAQGRPGGDALALSVAALKPYAANSEDLWRGYLRMRLALLFPDVDTGWRWALCPHEMGDTWGEGPEGVLPTECMLHKLPLRPLTWDDLDDPIKPKEAR
jgi:hypothetical protein